jgi:hypothetical protein
MLQKLMAVDFPGFLKEFGEAYNKDPHLLRIAREFLESTAPGTYTVQEISIAALEKQRSESKALADKQMNERTSR